MYRKSMLFAAILAFLILSLSGCSRAYRPDDLVARATSATQGTTEFEGNGGVDGDEIPPAPLLPIVIGLGDNRVWQLGSDADDFEKSLVPIKGLVDARCTVVMLACGASHSLALDSDGRVWSWGANDNGECARRKSAMLPPGVIEGLPQIAWIATGEFHSFAVDMDGTIWGWGKNGDGRIGNGTTEDHFAPVRIRGLAGVIALGGGGEHSIALLDDGSVWTWGDNSFGQLGSSAYRSATIPKRLRGLENITAIASGADHCLALASDGFVYAWGSNDQGQCGIKEGGERVFSPMKVENLTDIQSISTGYLHSLALDKSGAVWEWGANESGQLAQQDIASCDAPLRIDGLPEIRAISASGYCTYAGARDGIWWGIGHLHSWNTPIALATPNGYTVAAVSGGWRHTLLLCVPSSQ